MSKSGKLSSGTGWLHRAKNGELYRNDESIGHYIKWFFIWCFLIIIILVGVFNLVCFFNWCNNHIIIK